jgi:dihydroorotate dehydrogenase
LPWDSTEIFARTKEKRKWCICKVSPTVTPEDLEFLITKLGFTQIHASNTLAIQGCGGLSGRTLIPYTLDIIRLIKEEWPEVTIIAGGGVADFSGVYEYLKEGADHVSLGSVCFNPLALRKILKKIEL